MMWSWLRIPKTMNDLVLFFRIKEEISHRKFYLIRWLVLSRKVQFRDVSLGKILESQAVHPSNIGKTRKDIFYTIMDFYWALGCLRVSCCFIQSLTLFADLWFSKKWHNFCFVPRARGGTFVHIFLSSTERHLYKSTGCNEGYLQRKKGQISDKCPGMEGDGHCVLGTKIGDKISWETIAVKGLSDVSLTSKGENKAFPPPSPPYNVVPLFELPIENNKHLNLEWRGGVWILLFSEVTLLSTMSQQFCRRL